MSDTDGVCISKLIALVRERPVLWDRQEEVYKNRKLTRKAWADICQALLENYDELSEEDQKAFGRSVIGKWANLRDNWLRYWRKHQDYLRTGFSNSKFKKYIHHEQLMFLSKVYSQSELHQEVEEIQVEVDVLSDPGTDFSSEELSQPPWTYGANSDETLWSLPIVQDEEPPQVPSLTEERHLYFFQSTLPLIVDFDENQVLEFHGAVLESIRRIKNGKNAVNIMPAPQPAYILAIAQPQGFLTNTELKPKLLTPTNNTKQCSESPVEAIEKKESERVSPLNVSSAGTQVTTFNNDGGRMGQVPTTPSEIDVSDLKNVVNRLDEISKKFEMFPFEDSYEKFGKYIGSFLRTLPTKKAQFLKRRIVRQVLRVQWTGKINSSHVPKSLETLSNNDSLSFKSINNYQMSNEVNITIKNQTPTEKVTAPILTTPLQSNKITNTIVEESKTKTIKTNGTEDGFSPTSPFLEKPNKFTCHICASICVSTADLRRHCDTLHEGYSQTFKSKTEPPKRGRPRKRKNTDNDVTT